MPRLLTLSRAARLLGTKRGVLQQRIKDGELSAFEGMISLQELLRAYPDARVEDDTMLDKVEQLKQDALTKPTRNDAMMPDVSVVATRVLSLGRELACAKSLLHEYSDLMERLAQRIRALEDDPQESVRTTARDLATWLSAELRHVAQDARAMEEMGLKDAILQVVAAHIQVMPSGHEFFVEGSASLLEAGLNAGLNLNYGCSDGSCGLCRARIVSGEVHDMSSQTGATGGRLQSGTDVLMCQVAPVGDLLIETSEAGRAEDLATQSLEAHVHKLERPTEAVAILRLRMPGQRRLRFLSGQYVSLRVGDGPPSSHWIANCPCEEQFLDFHIGPGSGCADRSRTLAALNKGDVVSIVGPHGDFVLREESPRSLIFVACDTGFAPVKSLIEHAVALDVAEHLHLYWLDCGAGGHYLHNLCRAWADGLDNFRYTPMQCSPALTGGDDGESVTSREAIEAVLGTILDDHPDTDAHDFYIAGPEATVVIADELLRTSGVPDAQHFMTYGPTTSEQVP